MYDDEEIYEEGFEHEIDGLSFEDILEIKEEYRKRRLLESLIGPIASTLFHLALIIILAFVITDKYSKQPPEIEVKMEEVQEVQIEEPPPVEEPEPIVEPEESVTNPTLTTIAIENVETNDTALDDVSDEEPSTEDDSTVDAVSDIVVSPSAFASPNVFGGRSAAGRAGAVSKFGGTKAGQASLLKALWWLAKVQNPDGSWGSKSKPGLTGLALLTFLAHGETHLSKDFGKTVKSAIQWLVNDKITKGSSHGGYDHAIKTYALSEAYAMTGVDAIAPQMNKCIEFLIDAQQEGGSYDYHYKKGDSRQDLSLAGWHYQAMKAAYGAGCEVEALPKAIQKSIACLKAMGGSSVSFTYESKQNNFESAPRKRQISMRAVGSLCLQLFGEGNCPEIRDDIKMIATEDIKRLDWKNPPEFSLYGWYYATQVMFQSGGKNWAPWNRKFQPMLTKNQNTEGYWEYPDLHAGVAKHLGGAIGERVYGTTLAALMLTVYYRYLPSSKSVNILTKKDKQKKKQVREEIELDLLD
ncbi:MAG: hypothetical protein MK132_16115 [Lentisphaerales bacterium]|nr:hypothetical protein [Lentisphaerales bacterium]